MITNFRKLAATVAVCSLLAGTSALAGDTQISDTSDAQAPGAVVFGKFRLIRNGAEAKLGHGIFVSAASLKVHAIGSDREIVAKVGKDGEFAWVLEPGYYSLSNIAFTHRGETVDTDANFTFTVAAGQEAVYVGTFELDATFDSGYYGVSGHVDRYTVSNDCATDCADRLTRLGISPDAASIALLHEQRQIASRE